MIVSICIILNADVINVAVREDVSVNDSITTISASDPDGPSDGEVFYEFEGISPVSNIQ